jgi:DNA adenine methylase
MSQGGDVRVWLRAHGHADVARKIDVVLRAWAKAGKKTRRNWWDVLAGNNRGRSRSVAGVLFPILPEARRRQRQRLGLRREKRIPVGGDKKLSLQAPTSMGRHARRSRRTSELGLPRAVRDGVSPTSEPAPKPFIKWAGGKRQLLVEILKHIPAYSGRYHEPFVGGGAVFFALRPPTAFLSDSNERLVRCYQGIQKNVHDVIALLRRYRNSRTQFLRMRDRDIDRASDAEVAAWFIFLNKTGFNGLYRVNSKNRFNVPYGDNSSALICDEANLKACARALEHATIATEDYSAVRNRALPGDLVYFDPPYMPLSATSYFTSYTAQGFGEKDQIALSALAEDLKERGVHVLLSNSVTAAKFYSKKVFSLSRVLAARPVNSRADRRGKIPELLIR